MKKKNQKKSKSRMLTDNEVRKIAADTLQFKGYVETLEEIISTSATPLTIGVFGEWGSGKTSLMRMTESILRQDATIKTVWFDAWKFEKAYDLRVALIHEILKKIEKDMSTSEKLRIRAKSFLKRVFAGGLKSAVSHVVPALAPHLKAEEADQKTIQLIGDFVEEFNKLTKAYVSIENSSKEDSGKEGRLVIFIDDLDRCIPEKTIDILEAIKLFLNVPQSVFVIGADKKVIANGIMKKYKEESEEWGRNYLEKIIQVPFRLPPISKKDIAKDFIPQLDVSKEIKGYAPILAEVGDNPRQIKRLMNNFELQRILANKRSLGVKENILAKLTVLEFRWHNFYLKLIELYSKTDGEMNLIRMFKEPEEERDAKLSAYMDLKKYFGDISLKKFLEKEPVIFDVNLSDYVYLASTTKEAKEDAADFFNRGYLSFKKGDYDHAIEYYSEAIKLDPENVNAYHNRGSAYNNIGEYDNAIKNYDEALKLNSNFAMAYTSRGTAYNGKQEYDKALDDYNKAIELDPDSYVTYTNRGIIYENIKRRYDVAINDYAMAIVKSPKYKRAYNNLKSVLELLNKRKDLIPININHSAVESAISNSKFDKSQKDFIITLVRALRY